jgi:hypothetical protein
MPETEASVNDEELLKAAIAEEAAELRSSAEDHPGPDQLLAYQNGELTAADRDHVQEHLAFCPDCARAVLDLTDFPEVAPAGEVSDVSEHQVMAEWRRYRTTTDVTGIESRVSPARRFSFLSPHLAYGLAAGFLVAAIGLSLWVVTLNQQVEDLSHPRVNVHIGDLMALEAGIERHGEAVNQIVVPGGSEHVLLLLNLVDFRSYTSYLVTIADDRHEVWRSAEVNRTTDGNFTIEVSRSQLPTGHYQVTVFGVENGSETELATYVMDIAYQ